MLVHPKKVQPISRLAKSCGKRYHFPYSYLPPSPHNSPCPLAQSTCLLHQCNHAFSLSIHILPVPWLPIIFECSAQESLPLKISLETPFHIPGNFLSPDSHWQCGHNSASPCPCLGGTFIHTCLSDKRIIHTGMVVYAYNHRAWKTETGEPRVHYQPHLHSGLKIRLGSVIPRLKQNIK